MRIALFCHSLLSDWNHGNAHFLRGIVTELTARGHSVKAYEPEDAWSVIHLEEEPNGSSAMREVRSVYPALDVVRYRPGALDLDRVLDGVALVLVHEWNDPALVRDLGARRAANRSMRLLFHDTHHRAVTAPHQMARYDLSHYDGVLAFGRVLADLYASRRYHHRVWTWHEAADVRVFYPRPGPATRDVVFIGNWGDDERSAELYEYLFEPSERLGLRATVHGVRYPGKVRSDLARRGVDYRGFLPNYRAPEVFARHRVTLHIPRAPYARSLVGIPTIRPFEALACGIPLVSAPWSDVEGLFRPGRDYLVARTGREAERHLRDICSDIGVAAELAASGLETIRARHTCAHRVDELFAILGELGLEPDGDDRIEGQMGGGGREGRRAPAGEART